MRNERRGAVASRSLVCSFSVLVAVAAGLAATSLIDAAVVRKSLDQLVREADMIVSGRVVKQRFHSDDETIYTTSRVSITETVKGEAAMSVDTVTQDGIRDGNTIYVPAKAQFDIGQETVVFLRRDGTLLEVVAGLQGKFDVAVANRNQVSTNGDVTSFISNDISVETEVLQTFRLVKLPQPGRDSEVRVSGGCEENFRGEATPDRYMDAGERMTLEVGIESLFDLADPVRRFGGQARQRRPVGHLFGFVLQLIRLDRVRVRGYLR